MKHIKDIKNKLEWEQYYNQDFKTVTETIKMDTPKTQFDMDTMILL